MPTVSVIIAAYNPGAYLEAAIRSVLSQTWQDWEIVIVDDGSSEDLSFVTNLSPAIRLIRQKNSGQSVARNTGILHSAGEHLAFLDQDDLWASTKLERQLQTLESVDNAGLCHTDFEIIDAEGRCIGAGFQGYDRDYLDLLTGCGIQLSTVMIRRACLAVSGLFDPLLPSVADYDMWLKIARHYGITRVNSCETYWRQHGRNDSQSYLKMYQGHVNVLSRHLLRAQTDNDQEAIRACQQGFKRARTIYGGQAYDQCRLSLRRRQLSAASGHFRFSVRHTPRYVVRSVWLRTVTCLQRRLAV